MTRTLAHLTATLVTLGLFLGLCATSAQAGLPASDNARLKSALTKITATGIPGAAAVRRGPGNTIQIISVGTRQRGTTKPIGLRNRFRIASVSKAFNATLVYALAGEGKLRLNDTVEKWLPGLLGHGNEISIEQLLQHTSGLPDYTHDAAFREEFGMNLLRRFTAREVIAFVANDPLEFTPGTKYEYSDTDNLVAGLVVEAAAEASYAHVLRTRILNKLGMTDTFLATGTFIPGAYVHGYQFDEPGKKPLLDLTHAISPSAAGASGAMVSSLRDLSHFWQALLSGKLIKPALVARMLAPTVAGGGSPLGPGANRSGKGVFAWRVSCGTIYGHTGSFPGYQTFSGGPKNGRTSVVVMANGTLPSPAGARAQTAAYQEAGCQAIKAAR